MRTDVDRLDGEHHRTLLEMTRLASVHRQQLGALSDPEIRLLARHLTRRHLPEQVIGRLVDATAGNALLVTELLRLDPSAWDEGSETVADVVRCSLSLLDPTTRATLAVASLTPLAVEGDLVAEVSDQSARVVEQHLVVAAAAAVVAAAAVAAAAGILEVVAEEVRFRHALLANAARRELLPWNEARLHGLIGDALAGRPDVTAAEIARHLERAGRPVEAFEPSVQAARTSAGDYGSQDAVAHYERAIRLIDDPVVSETASVDALELAIEGLECGFYVGDAVATMRCAAAPLALCSPDADRDRWIALMCRASELAWQHGDTDESLRLLDRAEAALTSAAGPGARAHVVERRSFHAAMSGDGARALELASTAVELAKEAGDRDLEVEGRLRVGLAQTMCGALENGVDTLRSARSLAAATGNHRSVVRATINLTALFVGAGELAAACTEAELGSAIAAELDAPLAWQTHAVAWWIVALVGGGELRRAERLLNESTSPPAAAFSAVLDIAGAELAWTAGDFIETNDLLQRVSMRPQDHLGWWLRMEFLRRSVHLHRGERVAAREDIELTLDLAEFWPDSQLLRLCALAIDAATPGDTAELDRLLARAESRAARHRRRGVPIDADAWWRLVQARHAAGTGHPSGELYRAAADAFAGCGRWIDEGWALVHACRAGAVGVTAESVGERLSSRTAPPPRHLVEAVGALRGQTDSLVVADAPAPMAFADCVVDPQRFELQRHGVAVRVEPQVLELIIFLARHPQELLTKERLLDEIWGDRFVSESALTTCIKTTRRALGDDGKRQTAIKTVPRRGYRFIADVQPRHRSPAGGRGPRDL